MQKHTFYSLILALILSACNSDKPENKDTTAENSIVKDTILPAPNMVLNIDTAISGQRLFVRTCGSCHSSNQVNHSAAPALGGVTRRRTKAWLYAFTRNSGKLIASGDTAAVNIWRDWNGGAMTAFPDLTDAELDSIYSFVEAEYQRNKPVIRIRRVWLDSL